MIARTIKGKSPHDIQSALQQSMGDGYKPTLAFIEKELPDADAIVIFSCIGRLSSLGPVSSSELDGLAATWNIPMAGFFSMGEFGKLDDSRPDFHGSTVSWVALKEILPSSR